MALEFPSAFTQNETFNAEITRRALGASWQRGATVGSVTGGLIGSGDFLITYGGSGLGVSIAIGEALVGGGSVTTQGGYVLHGSSTTALTPAAANPSNPRVDLVCLTVADRAYAGSSDIPLCQVLTGTPTPGATITPGSGYLSGAPALPVSSLLLGYVLIPASAAAITSANILNVATAAQINGLSKALAVPGAPVNMTGSRSLGVPYQPNATRPVLVSATVSVESTGSAPSSIALNIGASPSPGTTCASAYCLATSGTVESIQLLSIILPVGWYYELAVTSVGASQTIVSVFETVL